MIYRGTRLHIKTRLRARVYLRAAEAVYASGGTGFIVDAASFASSAASLTKKNPDENCEFNKSSSIKPMVVR
tara:strand:- start:638 stop:853 length:216 start_codon:yes stop_codon:yes gene_type:complete